MAEEEFVNFAKFRELVGASIEATKEAIDKIPVNPMVPLHDRRMRLYPVSRVDEVRQWIRANLTPTYL